MIKSSSFLIKQAQTANEKQSIYRLRYAIYVEEMKRQQHHACHLDKKIEEPLDRDAILYGAYVNNALVGTIRLNYAKQSDLHYYDKFYRLNKHDSTYPYCSITTKLMTLKEYRSSSVVRSLIYQGYQRLLKDGLRYNYIDANEHLVPFFLKLGYQFIEEPIQPIRHEEYGDVYVMKLVLNDEPHLRLINSPFRKLLLRHLQEPTMSEAAL